MKRSILAAASGVALIALLAGCTSNDTLANDYRDGTTNGYISGDGAVVEVAAPDRKAPVVFEGTDENGDTVSSADLAGDVVVVNFWYAGCPPCRKEAPDLEALHQQYKDQGVSFVGVNTSDSAETALAFARKFGVTYPSILDVESNAVQLAFAGQVAPNAVPTTLVLDKQGRVAARFSGLVSEPKNLGYVITDALAEEG